MKKTPVLMAGVFFIAHAVFALPQARAAVPSPAISLTATASKISGTAWTNDGSLGGSVTLATANTPAPSYSAADTSVALNAVAGTKQYLTKSLGNGSALSEITFEMNINLKSTQSNASSNGMLLGWNAGNYSVWTYGDCMGFNTGSGEIYGINKSGLVNTYHTYTFVMSTYQDNSTKQRIFVDGVQQALSLCTGSAPGQTAKVFGTPATFTVGRYGINEFYGTFNIRSFKLWTSELTTVQIQESANPITVPSVHTISLSSGLSTAIYRTVTTIRSTVDVDGTVTFFYNGKRIAGCTNIATSSNIANCNWKPSVMGFNYLTAQLKSPGGSLTSTRLAIFVSKRSNNR